MRLHRQRAPVRTQHRETIQRKYIQYMILFIFEGNKREPMLFRSIERMFFPNKTETICYSFGNDIYELYTQLNLLGDGADIVSLLRDRAVNDTNNPLHKFEKTSDFSEIFLFFDLDIHDKHIELNVKLSRIEKLLNYFDNETDNGKLYINYPMIESIRYTKALPDTEYYSYVISRYDCCNFKNNCHNFSTYKDLNHLCLDIRESHHITEECMIRTKTNWKHLIDMNVAKANYICSENNEYPSHKEDISQPNIFKAQQDKYLTTDTISILNAFPIFIFDYFK